MRSLHVCIALLFLSPVAFIAAASPEVVVPPEPASIVHRVTREEVAVAKETKVSVLRSLFAGRAGLVSRFNRIDPRFVHAGTRLKVPRGIRAYAPMPAEWSPAANVPKAIVIALDLQFLGTYESGVLVDSYPVSSGRPGYETPEGRYSVTKKDELHASSKYPEETNGGWPMPFALRFHGTEYWMHSGDLKGYADSHGCVRLMDKDAKALFEWADVGTPVRVVASLASSPFVPSIIPPPPPPALDDGGARIDSGSLVPSRDDAGR